MTLAQLRALFRSISGDDTSPYRTDDTLLDAWINEAEEEACVRARLLYETDVVSITLVLDQAAYSLSSATISKRYFWVDGLRLTTSQLERDLTPRTMDEMIDEHPGWQYSDSGIPEHYITDLLPESVTLWPAPSSDVAGDAMKLRGFKLPDAVMSADSDEPDINAQWHRKLINWPLYQHYKRTDAENITVDASDRALAEFERDFGVRPDAKLQQLLYRKQGIRFKPRFQIRLFGTS